MNDVNSANMDVLKLCNIPKKLKLDSGWYKGYMRYMCGDYVLRSVPVVFRMEQQDSGLISLRIGGDGARITGEQVNTSRTKSKITEAVLVSERLPMKVRMTLMVPPFRKMVPFSIDNHQAFSFDAGTEEPENE